MNHIRKSVLKDAKEAIEEAIELDLEGKYKIAYPKYQRALELFVEVIKYENNESNKKILTQKLQEYTYRAETLKAALTGKKKPAALFKGDIQVSNQPQKQRSGSGEISSSKDGVKGSNSNALQLENFIEAALRNQKEAPYRRSKLMVVGEGRSGKTSTIRSLISLPFNENQESTKGFDVKRIDARNWTEDDKNYLIEYLEDMHQNNPSISEKPQKPARDVKVQAEDNTVEAPPVQLSKDEVKKYGEKVMFAPTSDNEKPLSFSIWDFGGQKVFYSLHHLFLTEFGCYLLVFDATRLLNIDHQSETVDYLKFWLYSKKIHAPAAPILIVATHTDNLDEASLEEINIVINKSVLGTNEFNEIINEEKSYFAVDNRSGKGINALRKAIEETVMQEQYINDKVPVSFLRLLELLLNEEKKYLRIQDVQETMRTCGLSELLFQKALQFLTRRGLATYFAEHEFLRTFVVLQPQWLIDGITAIIFDEKQHKIPKFGRKFNAAFRSFQKDRVITAALLKEIWGYLGYDEETQQFFKTTMINSSLMCNYSFDGNDSFLVPSLFSTSQQNNFSPKLENHDESHGPTFIIDFSGKYDAEIAKDKGKFYVRYLPYGITERLICLLVQHSAAYKNSMVPDLQNGVAMMSFGTGIDFEVRTFRAKTDEASYIQIACGRKVTFFKARSLVKIVFSMLVSLKEDFFSKSSGKSQLSMSLLLKSSSDSDGALAEYELLEEMREQGEAVFRPCILSREIVKTSSFNAWFEGEAKSEKLSRPDKNNEVLKHEIKNVRFKEFPEGIQNHCFLSYKQSSAIDIIGRLHLLLALKGYKAWYDQQQEEINVDTMREGVRNSMCYILFLSDDIFPSPSVEVEVKAAIQYKKPIIFMHHPDTGKQGHWSFTDFISKAPQVLRPLFNRIESLHLQRRYYLEEAVLTQLGFRLQKILNRR